MFPQTIRPALALGLLSILSLSTADFIGARVERFSDRFCVNQIDELSLSLGSAPSGGGSDRQFSDFVESDFAGSVALNELAVGCNIQVGFARFGFDFLQAPQIHQCMSFTTHELNQQIDLNMDKFRLGCVPGATSLPN